MFKQWNSQSNSFCKCAIAVQGLSELMWLDWWPSMVKRRENSLLGIFHLVYIAVQTLRIKEKAFSLSLCYLTWAKVFLGLFSGKAREHHFLETTPGFISFKSLFKVIMYSNRHGQKLCECQYKELNNEIFAQFLFGPEQKLWHPFLES